MSFLEVEYESDADKRKQIRIISLEQVLGQHLALDQDLRLKFSQLAQSSPQKYHFAHSNRFSVLGPNGTPITFGNNGKSPWFLIHGVKDERKQINMLLIGHSVWGLEVNTGLKIKKSIEKYGKEKIKKYLYDQIESLLVEPEDWQQICGYCI